MARDHDRPTMQDIADKVGVSKALVSLEFRNAAGPSAETRQRVFAAADELGYRMNRTAALMTARRTHHLGVTINIRNSFHTEIAEHIVAAADRAGYEVVLGAVTPTHGETKVIETLLDFRCEGILLIGPESSNDTLALLGKQVPSVIIGRRVRADSLDVVRTADGRGIGTVVDHLVGLGHRRVVHVSGGSGIIAADRCNGYLRAMRDTASASRPTSSRATSPSPPGTLRHNDYWLPSFLLPWFVPMTALLSVSSTRYDARGWTCPARSR